HRAVARRNREAARAARRARASDSRVAIWSRPRRTAHARRSRRALQSHARAHPPDRSARDEQTASPLRRHRRARPPRCLTPRSARSAITRCAAAASGASSSQERRAPASRASRRAASATKHLAEVAGIEPTGRLGRPTRFEDEGGHQTPFTSGAGLPLTVHLHFLKTRGAAGLPLTVRLHFV